MLSAGLGAMLMCSSRAVLPLLYISVINVMLRLCSSVLPLQTGLWSLQAAKTSATLWQLMVLLPCRTQSSPQLNCTTPPMLHTNTPLNPAEVRFQALKNIRNMSACLEKRPIWLGAALTLPEVVAMALSILRLSRVGAGVGCLSHSTFIYYTETRTPQNLQSITLSSVLLELSHQCPLDLL